MEIRNLTVIVRSILYSEPQTRDDDYLLWLRAIRIVAAEKGFTGFEKAVSVESFLSNVKGMPLPKYETVSRARRKLQALYPELRGTERTQKARAKREKEFREFAKIV